MVELDYIVVQVVNTLYYGSILFLVASGLSLIFGIMGILNLAHGAFYMLGAYVAYTLITLLSPGNPVSFIAGFAAATLFLALAGALTERGVIRPIYGKPHEIQLLLTFALMLILDDVVKFIWGFEYKSLTVIPGGKLSMGSYSVPLYIVYVTILALIVTVILHFFFVKTTIGKQMRATAYNPEVAAALGINVNKLFILAFALGTALSGLAGAAAMPVLTVYPGMGAEAIVLSFAVIVIGGMGSIPGALVGALIVSMARTLMVNIYPVLEVALIYIVMSIILLVKPTGLFGVEEVERH